MSTVVTSNISDGTTSVGTSYVVNGSAKNWVIFNGQGTIAIQDSFNVSAITDNGTGNYTVTFSTSMANALFAPSVSLAVGTNACDGVTDFERTASSVKTTDVRNQSNTITDAALVAIHTQGDLA